MKLKESVAFKLSARFTAIVSLVIVIIMFFFLSFLRVTYDFSQKNILENTAHRICDNLTRDIMPDVLGLPHFISTVIFYDDSDEVLYTNDPFLPLLKNTEGRAKRYYAEDYYADGDLRILYYVESVIINDRIINVECTIDTDRQSSKQVLNLLPPTSVLILPLILISFLLSLLITKRTLKPVTEITKAAKEMSSTNLETLLPVSKKNNELDQLASTFNTLFEDLRKDFEQERNFTSNVSHELKTPVAGILGQANLLKRWGKNDPAQLDNSLDLIINEANSMNYIITNLLQISKLEKGSEQIFKETLSIVSLFTRIKNEFAAISENIDFIYDDSNSLTLNTDIELLHQVITAIVANSVKFYTSAKDKSLIDDEKCIIEFRAENTDGKNHLEIIDNGPGFEEDVLPHIFERFFRGDKAHTRSAGGAGLGLSISASIIKAMGGTISAGNRQDKPHGAVLYIDLP